MTAAKFWQQLQIDPDTDCWLWTGAKQTDGYGNLRFNGISELAHRVAYRLHYGFIPEGKCVLHRCDVPACCNPSHLFAGTQRENIADRTKKNRSHRPIGASHPRAVVTPSMANEIKGLRDRGWPLKDIANHFTLSVHPIRQVLQGKHWTQRKPTGYDGSIGHRTPSPIQEPYERETATTEAEGTV